jgi:ribosomal protein L37AE/L43A
MSVVVAVGKCEKCGSEIVRPQGATVGVCATCKDLPLVKLRSKVLPVCPDCGRMLKNNGNDSWECLNPKCKVIDVEVELWNGLKVKEVKRSAL